MDLKYLAQNAAAAERARLQATALGTVGGKQLWSERELVLLRRHFPNYTKLLRLLKTRTRSGIKNKAGSLGLTSKYKAWTTPEISRLRRMYPSSSWNDMLLAFPGRTREQIGARARFGGLQRPRPPYLLSGNKVLDDIRQRCRSLNYTMPDLDSIAKTKRYFSSRHWTKTRTTSRAMAKAVAALDGEIKIAWRD